MRIRIKFILVLPMFVIIGLWGVSSKYMNIASFRSPVGTVGIGNTVGALMLEFSNKSSKLGFYFSTEDALDLSGEYPQHFHNPTLLNTFCGKFGLLKMKNVDLFFIPFWSLAVVVLLLTFTERFRELRLKSQLPKT